MSNKRLLSIRLLWAKPLPSGRNIKRILNKMIRLRWLLSSRRRLPPRVRLKLPRREEVSSPTRANQNGLPKVLAKDVLLRFAANLGARKITYPHLRSFKAKLVTVCVRVRVRQGLLVVPVGWFVCFLVCVGESVCGDVFVFVIYGKQKGLGACA